MDPEYLQAAQDEMKARHELGNSRGAYKKRGPSGKGHMWVGDALYEMLPCPTNLEKMAWYPRDIIRFPPNMRSTGVQESVSMSASKIIRQFLLDERKLQCDRQGRNRFLQVLVNLTNIASKPGPQAVAAATLLFDRGFGKSKPSDEELDATRGRGGFQIIYINKVEGNIPIEQAPEEPAPPQLPEFINAEFGEAQ